MKKGKFDLKLKETISSHNGGVLTVCLSPDQSKLCSAGGDGKVILTNLQNYHTEKVLIGHKGSIFGSDFSSKGVFLATASKDQSCRIWNLESEDGNFLKLEGHSSFVRCARFFRNDSTRVVTGSLDETIKIWGIEGKKEILTLKGCEGDIFCVDILPGDQAVVSGDGNELLRIWDIRSGECVQMLDHHRSSILSVQFHPSTFYLASGSADKTIKIIDIRTFQLLQDHQEHSDYVTSVCFHPSGNFLVSGSHDNTVKVFDLLERRVLFSLKEHTGGVHSVQFSSDGKCIASGSKDKKVFLWNFVSDDKREESGNSNKNKSQQIVKKKMKSNLVFEKDEEPRNKVKNMKDHREAHEIEGKKENLGPQEEIKSLKEQLEKQRRLIISLRKEQVDSQKEIQTLGQRREGEISLIKEMHDEKMREIIHKSSQEKKKELEDLKAGHVEKLKVLEEDVKEKEKVFEQKINTLKQQTQKTRSDRYLSDLEYDESLLLDPSLHFRKRYFVGINQKIDQIIFHDAGREKDFKDLRLRQQEQVPDSLFETIVSDPQKDDTLKKFLKTIRTKFFSKWKERQINIKKNQQQLTKKEFKFFQKLVREISNFFGGTNRNISTEQQCDRQIKKLKEEKARKGEPCNTIYLGELKGNGVCRHRSILFKLVCDVLGIRCRLLRGWFRHNEKNYGHCWNMVQLGGKFFMVDVMLNMKIFPEIAAKSYINLGGPSIEVEKEKKTLELIERDYLQKRELIKSGSFASVYEVEVDLVDQFKTETDFTTKSEIVAVKEMNVTDLSAKTGSDFWKYCEREMMFMKFLNHPNIIHFIGSFKRKKKQRRTNRKQEYFCLVMEFFDRTCYSFRDELKEKENPNNFTFYHKLCELFIFLIEVCKGLRYMHSVGVIHFDLHPDNILVKWNERKKRIKKVVITDFGGSKEKEASFRTSLPAGAPMFTAPEILELRMKAVKEGNLKKDRDYSFTEKSDIYSFGKVMEMFNSFLEGFPEVLKLEMECLERNPKDRPSLEKMIYIFKNRLRYVNGELRKLVFRNKGMKNVFDKGDDEEENEGEEDEKN